MLSIENPPESSSSQKKAQSSLNSVDKKYSSDNNLHDSQKHSFSIRDYVFSSRSNDIKSSWPFPQQSLQLCIKNGIKEILPPFEPPDLIRSQLFANKEVEQISPQAGVPSDKELVNLNYYSSLSRSRDKAKPLDGLDSSDAELINFETEIHSTLTSRDHSDKHLSHISELPSSLHVRSTSEASSYIDVAERPVLHEKQMKKKNKLIVKLSTISENNRAEDISSASTISDTMASNVCPVCKTFSSSSNTTLNAHIDQCLSEESNGKGINVANEPKVKVKPKKRLMVDIYTTAPVCTLEDLDRRNGTNWAAELAMLATGMAPEPILAAQTNKASVASEEVNNEAKKAKFLPEDENKIRDDGDEEAVYVDSNGIKLRILSMFNNVPPVVSKIDVKLKKHANNMKIGESSLLGKKKQFYAQHVKMKQIKLKQQGKKSTMLKLPQSQTLEALHSEFQSDDGREKEEAGADPGTRLKACRSLTKWVCSKRSDLAEKYRSKDIQMLPDNSLSKTRIPLIENNQADSHNVPIPRSRILKLSRLPEDLNSPPKTKKMDVFCSSEINIGNKASSKWRSECSSSASSLLLKLSRSTGKVISSPRSKRKEIRREITRYPSNFSQPLEEERGVKMDKNVFAGEPSLSPKTNKGDEKQKHVTNAKIRKHRSQNRCGKLVIPDAEGSHYVSRKYPLLDACRSALRLRPCKSNKPEVPEPIVSHDIVNEEQTEDLLDEQELQVHDATDDEFGWKEDYCSFQGDEFRAGTVSGQASITSSRSHGDSEIPHEYSSVTSTGPVQSQDNNLAAYTVTSGSPISTPNDPAPSHRPIIGPRDLCSNVSTGNTYLPSISCTREAEETIIEGTANKHAMSVLIPKGPEQLMNDHPCCCSRREALHGDSQLFQPNTGTVSSSIRPGSSNAFSSSRTDTIAMPSNSSFKYPSFIDFTSPIPSPRTQTLLRLMGTNLMVDKEQSPQLPSPIFDNPMNARYMSPRGFTSTASVQPQLYHHYHQFPGQVLARSLSESLYSGSVIPSYTQEVIVIDDSPEREAEPRTPMNYDASNIGLHRSLSCFPLPSRYITRDSSSSNSTPPFSVSRPRTNTTPMTGGSASEAPARIPPKPLPSSSSTARVKPHFYYAQTFW